MQIPLGYRHHVTIEGESTKLVRCAKCGSRYSYRTRRIGGGYGFSPLFLFQSRAVAKASAQAEKSLDRKLRTSADPVPCPSCGHYQWAGVWEVKKFWLATSLFIAAAMMFVFWVVPLAAQQGKVQLPWGVNVPVITAAFVVIALGLLIFIAYNPNHIPVRLFKLRAGQLLSTGEQAPDEVAHRLDAMFDSRAETVPGEDASSAPAPTASASQSTVATTTSPPPLVEMPDLDDFDSNPALDVSDESQALTPPADDPDERAALARQGKMKVACRHCGATFTAPIVLAGRLIDCRACGKPFRLERG